jgi:hypothetical protein
MYTICKELPNKDHATCGKERFIGPDHRAITPFGFTVRQSVELGSELYKRGQAMGEGERV